MPKVFVVLPAYNEEANLPEVLERIGASLSAARLPYHVIVVNDGSKDGTLAVAERFAASMPLSIHRHETNMGLGRTLADGLDAALALARPEDVVVTMDADATQDAALVPEMVRRLSAGPDVVIASRYRHGALVEGVPRYRRALSFGASLLMRILFPMHGVRDYTCGFRAYKAAALQHALKKCGGKLVDQSGFQCMVDVLLKVRRCNLSAAEVPITLRYDLKRGGSKMKVWRTVFLTLGLLVRRRLGW